jgi:hypothetical protein
MQRMKNRRRGRGGLTVSLALAVSLLGVVTTISSSHGKSRSRRKHTTTEPALAEQAAASASEEQAEGQVHAVYIFVKGTGILRLQDGVVSTVMSTQAALRDMQIDNDGALWASLRGVGVVRSARGLTATLNQESFAKLAIRSPTDVWAINDGHGSVVHYDGQRWKTVRTRNSLTGAFDDNRLLDIASDGRAVWVSSWNGLWRVVGGRWTHVAPPPGAAANGETEIDVPSAPAYPLSLLVARPGLIACYLPGCFVSVGSDWQPTRWPANKAHLQSAGAENLLAGAGADGRTVVLARLDGSGEASTSEPLPATGINDIAIDASERVWVATGAELIILDASGRTLQRWKTGMAGSPAGDIERVVVVGTGPEQLPAK